MIWAGSSAKNSAKSGDLRGGRGNCSLYGFNNLLMRRPSQVSSNPTLSANLIPSSSNGYVEVGSGLQRPFACDGCPGHLT